MTLIALITNGLRIYQGWDLAKHADCGVNFFPNQIGQYSHANSMTWPQVQRMTIWVMRSPSRFNVTAGSDAAFGASAPPVEGTGVDASLSGVRNGVNGLVILT